MIWNDIKSSEMYQAEKDFDSQQNNPYIDWADEVIVFFLSLIFVFSLFFGIIISIELNHHHHLQFTQK